MNEQQLQPYGNDYPTSWKKASMTCSADAGAASPCPPWRARPRTVPDTTLGRIGCPAFTRVFPKNRCERAASGISPDTKKFFCKSVFHTKTTPL
jgi:hypothetical protein